MATKETTANAAAKKQTQEQELMTEDYSFFDGMSNGFEDMGTNATSLAYLGLTQPDSSLETDDCAAGTWHNSASGKCYGNMIKVVPIAFRTIWVEREQEAPFRTIGRYPVGGIKVTIKNPPKGKKGYPKMINPETDNEVQELFVYAVILPDHPEDGILYFTPNVGSMRTAKSWNTMLKSQILPNGVQAPLFAYTWNLVSELVANPVQPTKQMAKFTKAFKDTIVNKELFTSNIKPKLDVVKNEVLQLTNGEIEVDDEQ